MSKGDEGSSLASGDRGQCRLGLRKGSSEARAREAAVDTSFDAWEAAEIRRLVDRGLLSMLPVRSPVLSVLTGAIFQAAIAGPAWSYRE